MHFISGVPVPSVPEKKENVLGTVQVAPQVSLLTCAWSIDMCMVMNVLIKMIIVGPEFISSDQT